MRTAIMCLLTFEATTLIAIVVLLVELTKSPPRILERGGD